MLREQGMSLINLMVSLTLSVSLLALLFQLMQQAQTNQQAIQMRLVLQEDAQLLLHTLTQELRLAGFSADVAIPAVELDDCNSSKQWILNLEQGIDTQNDSHNSVLGVSLESCLNLSVRPQTDMLFIRRLAAKPQQADQSFVKSWYLLKKTPMNESRYVYLEQWPDDLLTENDSLWRLESKVFYVRDYSIRGDNIPSLIMASPNAAGFDHQVVAENVEALQFQWLVKQGEDSFILLRQPQADELAEVVLLRLHLLMRGDKRRLVDGELRFDLAESYQPPQQEYYYQHFSSSVYLRNK